MIHLVRHYQIVFFTLTGLFIYGQVNTDLYDKVIETRARVIIANDFGGDPDGLFQLAHHLLSPTVVFLSLK